MGAWGKNTTKMKAKKNTNYVLMDIKKIREQENAPAQLN